MNDSFAPDDAGAPGPDTAIYLERDIFFNFRLSQLESGAAVVALNFRECILLRLLLGARVRKQAVIDAAWGDNGVVVTDASYHQLVRSLRKKFEEIGLSAQSIKTLPRFGLEYLREAPPRSAERSAAANMSAADESVKQGEVTLRRSGWRGGMRWPLRLLLLILPFLAGLLIGHLAYRGNTISAKKPGNVPNLEVSVSRRVSNGSESRFQCT
ncbi:hypothetical protein D9O50_04485 [Oxalobacteraceae bacterium CAVE-383]|nr:hypothetical protein D9O50_04485 [Oxalobacteraceae bacterium CAVE-383]